MKEKFNRESIIKIRGGYSDRNGFNPVSNTLQVDDLDDRTRTILSNAVFEVIDDVFDFSEKYGYDKDRYYDGQIFLKKCYQKYLAKLTIWKTSSIGRML